MLLNGAAINRFAINAAVAAFVVYASASFSADATVTSAATRTTHATCSLSGDMYGVFASDQRHLARCVLSASAAFAAQPPVLKHAARGAWDATAQFNAYTLRNVWAYAGFDAVSSFVGLANAKLATANWSSVASGFTATGAKSGALRGAWATAPASFSLSAYQIKQPTALFAGSASLWAETTRRNQGETIHRHEGYSFWSGSGAIAVDNARNPIIAHYGIYFLGTGEMSAPAHARYGARGAWSIAGSVGMDARKTAYPQCDFPGSTTSLSAQGEVIRGGAGLEASTNATLTAAAIVNRRGAVTTAATSALSVEPLLSRMARVVVGSEPSTLTIRPATFHRIDTAVFESQASLVALADARKLAQAAMSSNSAQFSGAANRKYAATAAWSGQASTFSDARRYSSGLAGDDRTFWIPKTDRTFVVPSQDRILRG